MAIRKKIVSMVVAMMMAFSTMGVGTASAFEYCGGKTKSKAWLTKNGNATYRDVGNIKSYSGGALSSGILLGHTKATYISFVGVKCTSYADYGVNYHYARVVSGGKAKEGCHAKYYGYSETGYVALKNKSARFSGYYVVK